jgi:hypothetical protein
MRKHEWSPCDLYHAYESAREEAESALADWSTALHSTRGDAFAVYRAAADREDAAAIAWLQACQAYDLAHGRAA